MSDDKRVFRAAVLAAMEEARKKVVRLDIDDADNWHKSLREAFVAISGVESLVLNAMNSDAIKRNHQRAKNKIAQEKAQVV